MKDSHIFDLSRWQSHQQVVQEETGLVLAEKKKFCFEHAWFEIPVGLKADMDVGI